MIATGRRSSKAGSEGGRPVNGLTMPPDVKAGIETPDGNTSGRITTSVGAGGAGVVVGRYSGVGAAAE